MCLVGKNSCTDGVCWCIVVLYEPVVVLFHNGAEIFTLTYEVYFSISFQYFIAFFNEMFNKGTRSADAKLAIKAFGLFAAVCRRYKGSQDVVHMFTSVKQRAEQIYFK